MERFRACYLFQKNPAVSGRKRILYWLWNWSWVAASAAGTGILSLFLAFGHYNWNVFLGYFRHPLICFLNLLPVALLAVFFYCLTGRAWIAFLAASAPVMAASVGNYFKILCRDDPFLFLDLADVGTALQISERYDISLDQRLAICLLCLAAGTIFLFFCVRGVPGHLSRRLPGAAAVLLCAIPLAKVYTSGDIYNNKTRNFEYASQWSATQVFLTKGFVYPFLHSIPEAFPEKPEGYSEKAAREILSAYVPEDIPADRKVDVIGIQLEAFNDLERIGFTGISPEVYAQYHALEAESLTGNLITNIFAGGTVQTERAFLTGDAALDNFRRDTGSYVWYFKEQGYTAEGCHPCYDYFYNRRNVNRYLGFDRYWFFQDRYEALNQGLAMDNILFPDILDLYRSRDPSVPYFHFSVSYQGHGPYPDDALTDGDGYWDGPYQEESTYYILNNYLRSVQDTAACLAELADGLRQEDSPVVLVVFGDHNPWLGYGNSVYQELGIDLDTSSKSGFYNYYGTRYLIWANDAAREVLGRDFTGAGPDVSPCFLMNVLFDQCGWGRGSAFMQLAGQVMGRTPVVSQSGFYLEDGQLTDTPSEEAQELLSRYEIAQYYRKRNPA